MKTFSLQEAKGIQEPFAAPETRPVRRWAVERKTTQAVAVFGGLEFDRQIAFVTRRELPKASQTARLWAPVAVLKPPAESFFSERQPDCGETMFVFVPAAQQNEAMSALRRLRVAWVSGRDKKMGYWPRLSLSEWQAREGMTFASALEGERVNRTTVIAVAKTPLGIVIAITDSGLWPHSPVTPLFLGCKSIPVDGEELSREKNAMADPRWGERAVAVHTSALAGRSRLASEKGFWERFHENAPEKDKPAVRFIHAQFEAREIAKTLSAGSARLREASGKAKKALADSQPKNATDRPARANSKRAVRRM